MKIGLVLIIFCTMVSILFMLSCGGGGGGGDGQSLISSEAPVAIFDTATFDSGYVFND